jgi:hypothetical protein
MTERYENGIWPNNCDPEYKIPKEIEILVDGSNSKNFSVQIYIDKSPKPYIGGYRNKNTGKLYHHAITQTFESVTFEKFKSKILKDKSNFTTRDSQTQIQRNHCTQGLREYGTQMGKSDLSVCTKYDLIIRPKQYKTFEEVYKKKTLDATTIQRYWRGSLDRRKVLRIKEENRKKQEEEDIKRYIVLVYSVDISSASLI